MARIYEIDRIKPVVPDNSFVHPDACLIGDVIIGENCYIGPMASLRGDFGRIVVGNGADIQDQCVLHSFPNKDCIVEENGHIAHGAILHGCLIKTHGFVGMNAVVMDDVVVGEYAMVAAMSFVKAGFEIPSQHLAAGSPAKIIKELTDKELGWMSHAPVIYQQLTERCLKSLKPTQPLSQVEPDRKRIDLAENVTKPLHVSKNE